MASTSEGSAQRQDAGYGWWVCAVMCLAFTFSYMDRAVLPLLVQPLEHALGLTDTTVGLLQGAAFAIFYSTFGFPLARIADNGHRRNLIVAGVIVWCAATVGCGLARNVPQLFIGRMCVAIGESVLQPAAVSILSDYFSPKRRTRALSVYSMGVYFGGGLALALGGTLMRAIGPHGAVIGPLGRLDAWRIVFVVLGASGLVLLPLLFTVREPARLSDLGERSHGASSLAELRVEFGRKRAALAATIVGFATTAMAATTMQSWAPTLFVRVHGWKLGQTGQKLGSMALVLSPLGALCGALIAERLAKAGRRDAKLIVGVVSAAGCALVSYLATISPATAAFVALAAMQFLVGFNFGLVQAALTELMPNRMRALATASFIATSNLLSATLGPLLVGLLNDHLFHNPMMIAQSLRLVAPTAFAVAAIILLLGLKPYRAAVLQSQTDQPVGGLAAVPSP